MSNRRTAPPPITVPNHEGGKPRMKLVIFGLTVRFSWGNGHAALWRSLCRALGRRGHDVVFFERDAHGDATQQDPRDLPGCRMVLYSDWAEALPEARRQTAETDVAIVASNCPEGMAATDVVLSSSARLRVFYELGTPNTLTRLQAGDGVNYIGPRGLADFDLVLSFTGGPALEALKTELRARRVAPLYGSVDPEVHRPVPPLEGYRADFSYLGSYAEDRRQTLERLFMEPARRMPQQKFMFGGARCPTELPGTGNVFFARHIAPSEYPAFYCSSRLTLNVARRAAAEMGFCPSGRLFEAAACGTPLVSEGWEGLEEFFEPGREILIAQRPEDVIGLLELPQEFLATIAHAARERTLAAHTADQRAADLEAVLEEALRPELHTVGPGGGC